MKGESTHVVEKHMLTVDHLKSLLHRSILSQYPDREHERIILQESHLAVGECFDPSSVVSPSAREGCEPILRHRDRERWVTNGLSEEGMSREHIRYGEQD